MKELILGFLPGSVFIYRYVPNFEISKLLGLFTMEIAPYLLVCYFEDINIKYVFIGFIVLYSIYDFGYVQNDTLSVNYEGSGRTIRNQFENFNTKIFVISRLSVVIFIIYFFWEYLNSYKILIALISIAIVFYVHNRIADVRYRVLSFLLLNNLKIIFRLLIISNASMIYFISFIPHIFIKLYHYLSTKELTFLVNENFNNLKFKVYIAFFISIIFINIYLSIVMLPMLFNHNKKYMYNFLFKK